MSKLEVNKQNDKIADEINVLVKDIEKIKYLETDINLIQIDNFAHKFIDKYEDTKAYGDIGFNDYNIRLRYYDEITNIGAIEREKLVYLGFPTGGYVLNDSWDDHETFDEFYEALHEVKPKYEDVINHNMYFSKDNSKEAIELFKKLLPKYTEISKKRYAKYLLEQKEEEVETLKNEIEAMKTVYENIK